ncbi:MAG: cell division protein ZapE, partial [Kiloniellales bacterium]
LFETLFQLGVVVVATSNWPPDQLYEGGLQREHFLPFIALVKERLDIMELDGPTDHRLARLKTMNVYHTPLSRRTSNLLEEAFVALTAGARPIAETLTVKGREMAIPRAVAGVARFAFAELCEAALGAEDYLAIARRYHAVILDGVPKLSPERRDVARRFMTLIDALYEHRVKLVVGAEALPEKLYPQGQVAFEFQRTVSRLAEMQSASYLAAPHLG